MCRWLFYRAMYPFCDVLVYVCENQRKYWRRRALRARSEAMIYNGIDTAYFSPDSVVPDREAMRAKLGFASNGFRSRHLCGAATGEGPWRPAGGHRPSARPRLPGTLPRDRRRGRTAMLEARAVRWGSTDRVEITGYEMDVRPHIAACDVMVLTSHSETFSLSALESMAMGKPMVMTSTGGAAEQVKEGTTGFLFAPGDVAALASASTRWRCPDAAVNLWAPRQPRTWLKVSALENDREVLGTFRGAGRVDRGQRVSAELTRPSVSDAVANRPNVRPREPRGERAHGPHEFLQLGFRA